MAATQAVTAAVLQAFPLPAGFPTPSAVGPIGATAISAEALLGYPLQIANATILQFDAASRGVALGASGAAVASPFPALPLPYGII